MDLDELFSDLDRQAFVAIDGATLEELLAVAEIVREEDTLVAGRIRILSADGFTLVQEETPEGQALVRRVRSAGDGERLVEQRLEVYERMWDGCGCKVDYYAEDAEAGAAGRARSD